MNTAECLGHGLRDLISVAIRDGHFLQPAKWQGLFVFPNNCRNINKALIKHSPNKLFYISLHKIHLQSTRWAFAGRSIHNQSQPGATASHCRAKDTSSPKHLQNWLKRKVSFCIQYSCSVATCLHCTLKTMHNFDNYLLPLQIIFMGVITFLSACAVVWLIQPVHP